MKHEMFVHSFAAKRSHRLARALARRIVRVTAVAALAACGAANAADDLRDDDLDNIDDDDDLAVLAHAVDRATERVLQSPPHDKDDRALVVLVAAKEAVALAAVDVPSERHTAELLQTVGVLEHFAATQSPPVLLWESVVDTPPDPQKLKS